SFFDPVMPDPHVSVPSVSSSIVPVPVFGIADLAAPYFVNGMLSVEKRFHSGLEIVTSGNFVRGNHEFRYARFSAPAPSITYASAGSAYSRYLSVRLRTPSTRMLWSRVELLGDYTYGSAYDDNVTLAGATNWKSYWAPTNGYPRHTIWV